MRINYIREMNAWMDFVLDEEPSANAQLLWHALMALFNRRGEGDEWPEEIAISNQKLLLFLPFEETAFKEARAELEALGRIRHIHGRRGERPRYVLIPFAAEQAPVREAPRTEDDEGAVETVFAPESVDNSEFSTSQRDKGADRVADRVAQATQSRPLSQTLNAYAYTGEDDDEIARPRLRILSEPVNDDPDEHQLREAFRDRLPELRVTQAAVRDLLTIGRNLGMSTGVLCDAVTMASRRCARSPVDYIAALLDDWSREGVRTQTDLGELLVMRAMAAGKTGDGSVGWRELDEARERRRAR